MDNIGQKFEDVIKHAFQGSPFGKMLNELLTNMNAGASGGKDGGQSDSQMQAVLDKMTHPFGDA